MAKEHGRYISKAFYILLGVGSDGHILI